MLGANYLIRDVGILNDFFLVSIFASISVGQDVSGDSFEEGVSGERGKGFLLSFGLVGVDGKKNSNRYHEGKNNKKIFSFHFYKLLRTFNVGLPTTPVAGRILCFFCQATKAFCVTKPKYLVILTLKNFSACRIFCNS